MVACICRRIAFVGVCFPRKDSLEECVWMAFFLVAMIPDSVAEVVCRSSESGRVAT